MPLPDIYKASESFKAQLLKGDAETSKQIISYYAKSFVKMNTNITALSARIEQAKLNNEYVSPSWAFQIERYQALQAQILQETYRLSNQINKAITTSVESASTAGAADTLALMQLGAEDANIQIGFNKLPVEAVESVAAFVSEGSPFTKILAGFPQDAINQVRDAIVTSITMGYGADKTAREIKKALGINLNRALTIARTETMRAYRESGYRTMAENSDVLAGWVWTASFSRRTCAACITLAGSFHPITERMESHPRCRCSATPVVKGQPIDVEKGEDWFKKQDEETKRDIVGTKLGYDAIQSGRLQLRDFVGRQNSPQWGRPYYQLSVRRALRQEGQFPGYQHFEPTFPLQTLVDEVAPAPAQAMPAQRPIRPLKPPKVVSPTQPTTRRKKAATPEFTDHVRPEKSRKRPSVLVEPIAVQTSKVQAAFNLITGMKSSPPVFTAPALPVVSPSQIAKGVTTPAAAKVDDYTRPKGRKRQAIQSKPIIIQANQPQNTTQALNALNTPVAPVKRPRGRPRKDTAALPSTAAPPPPKAERKPKAAKADIFPETLDGLEEVRQLGGSTGARLMRDPKTGRQFVQKGGASADHLLSEFNADEIYRSFGANVPRARIYQTSRGPIKLAEFIEGRTLGQLSPAEKNAAKGQLQEHFLTDALLGNWDVIGLSEDNVLVDSAGKVWRIDNGGSLEFRAQGSKKTAEQWSTYPVEIWSLRNSKQNQVTARYFDTMTTEKVYDQIDTLAKKRKTLEKTLPTLPAALKNQLLARVDQAIKAREVFKSFTDDNFIESYADGVAKQTMGLGQAGVLDLLPKQLKGSSVSFLYDENNQLFDHMRSRDANDPRYIVGQFHRYLQKIGARPDMLTQWATNQASSSWSTGAVAFKRYFQKARKEAFSEYFWPAGKYPTEADVDRDADYFFNNFRGYGQASTVIDDTIQAQHALVYATLQRVELPNTNQKKGLAKLLRTEGRTVMRNYGYWSKTKDIIIPRGVNESASILKWTKAMHDSTEKTVQFVPFTRITGLYMYDRSPGYNRGHFLGDSENEFTFIPVGIRFDFTGSMRR